MTLSVRYIAEVYNTKTEEVVKSTPVFEKSLAFPKDINQFGLRHKEQIDLITNSQNAFLIEQCELFSKKKECPKCRGNLRKAGKKPSSFHDVFSDHKVYITRMSCTCGFHSPSTISGIYGSATHPELLKKQSESSSENSFRGGSKTLNNESCYKRPINNYMTLSNNIDKVGSILNDIKLNDSKWIKAKTKAEELIVVIDGGYVQYLEKGKHNFEELMSTVYNPEHVIPRAGKDAGNKITHKNSVGSALSDGQNNIKMLTINALKKSGMDKSTKVSVFTDGANNCWSVVAKLDDECKQVTRILDWFHVGKHYTETSHIIPEELKKSYNNSKWYLYHDKADEGIVRLCEVRDKLTEEKGIERIQKLIDYVTRNKAYFCDYSVRQKEGLPISSQLAECAVNNVINQRQKNKQMQWSREGANNILQIRGSIFSGTWEDDWKYIERRIYKKAA